MDQGSPYDTRGAPDTSNQTDSIFQQGGSQSMPSVGRHGNGYRGSISMGVQR